MIQWVSNRQVLEVGGWRKIKRLSFRNVMLVHVLFHACFCLLLNYDVCGSQEFQMVFDCFEKWCRKRDIGADPNRKGIKLILPKTNSRNWSLVHWEQRLRTMGKILLLTRMWFFLYSYGVGGWGTAGSLQRQTDVLSNVIYETSETSSRGIIIIG